MAQITPEMAYTAVEDLLAWHAGGEQREPEIRLPYANNLVQLEYQPA